MHTHSEQTHDNTSRHSTRWHALHMHIPCFATPHFTSYEHRSERMRSTGHGLWWCLISNSTADDSYTQRKLLCYHEPREQTMYTSTRTHKHTHDELQSQCVTIIWWTYWYIHRHVQQSSNVSNVVIHSNFKTLVHCHQTNCYYLSVCSRRLLI